MDETLTPADGAQGMPAGRDARATGNPQAKHESGAVAREESLRFATREDGSQIAVRPDGTQMRILTGDRTTGKLHLGHWVGSLKNRVRLQHIYDTFILMADVQALTTHYDRPEILRESVWDVALDYLAAGIDPDKATIVVQSLVPAIADLTVYYGLLVPVGSLTNNPTVKTEAEQQGFNLERTHTDSPPLFPETTYNFMLARIPRDFAEVGSIDAPTFDEAIQAVKATAEVGLSEAIGHAISKHSNDWLLVLYHEDVTFRRQIRDELIRLKRQRGFTSVTYGFLGYPISQAADITFVDADLVPVGVDQVPLIELCREVVHRFNSQYASPDAPILREPQALLGSTELIRGIDGSAKMSKSQNNAIYLSETDEEIWGKLKPAPTDPQRVRKTDPGRPEMCNIFSYHATFCGTKEPAIDEAAIGVASVDEVAHNCRTAAWGCIDCKKNLALKLKALLDPMRERRAQWAAQPHKVRQILLDGTARARAEGEKTLARVRTAMGMDYFE